MNNKAEISRIVEILKSAERVLFITGAGISADSGLPTYRGIGGLYNSENTEDGIPIEMALAGEMIETRPQITWKYLAQIEENCRGARYNRAHEIMALMEECFKEVWVLTQNIDGFHHDAGSRNVINIHGDLHELFCPECGWETRVDDYSGIDIPPRCPECGTIVRPAVVFFGEQLPFDKVQTLYNEMRKGFDVYFSVGTTSVFPYIQEPILKAKREGSPAIEINPAGTEVSSLVDIKLCAGASEAMDAIWRKLNDAGE